MNGKWMLAGLCMFAGSLAQAAILVISEGSDGSGRQYFENGAFVLIQDGRPAFGVDESGNCWFTERDRLVFDSCERMLDAMSGMRDQAMAGMSQGDRAMMEQMMAMQRGAPLQVRPAGERTIAGYPSSCHTVGDSREVCVSAQLLDEIRNEMGNSRFSDMMQRFQNSAAEMGGGNVDALQQLFESGYPMSDRQKAASIPGLDPAMLNMLPEAQRAQIMQQMNAAGAGGQMRGMQVVGVEKGAQMPNLDLSTYQRMTFDQFMQQTMREMPGMPRR